MREFGTEFIPSPPPLPETREREAERAREKFLRPARAFRECTHTLFADGEFPPGFTENIAHRYQLDDRYRYALAEFAEFARTAGEQVDKTLAAYETESGSHSPDDRRLAQMLTGIAPRHPCEVDPHALGFAVRYTHPSDYLLPYWGTEKFNAVMEQRIRSQNLPHTDLMALPHRLYYSGSAALHHYHFTHGVSILSTYIDPCDPHWRAKYLEDISHEERHATNQALLPKIGETSRDHVRAQDMLVWALKHRGDSSLTDDAAFDYFRTLKAHAQFSLINELVAHSGDPDFSKWRSLEWLGKKDGVDAIYDYYGKSGSRIISGTLNHGTRTQATDLAREMIIPRMQSMRNEHLISATHLVSSFDAARIRLRLNPDDLSAGMAMQAAVSDRFDDFLDRVQQLAGQ